MKFVPFVHKIFSLICFAELKFNHKDFKPLDMKANSVILGNLSFAVKL